MHKAFVSIGSNVADAEILIHHALKSLSDISVSYEVSSIYQTEALNGIDAHYMNCVVYLKTEFDFESLTKRLKDIESEFGRTPDSKSKGLIELDLDIVVFDDNIIRPKDFCYDYFKIGYGQLKPSL